MQGKYRCLRIIAKPDRRSVGLGNTELYFFLGEGVSCLLVKEQVGGSKVHRILQLFGRGLIRMGQTAGVGLQIHLDFTLADDVARAGRIQNPRHRSDRNGWNRARKA